MKTTAICTIMMLFFCANVHAECSTEERIKLVQSGYSKTEVEQMCNKPSECCCSFQTISQDELQRFVGEHSVHQKYQWVNADTCLSYKDDRQVSTGFVGLAAGLPSQSDDSLAPSTCTSPSYCGR